MEKGNWDIFKKLLKKIVKVNKFGLYEYKSGPGSDRDYQCATNHRRNTTEGLRTCLSSRLYRSLNTLESINPNCQFKEYFVLRALGNPRFDFKIMYSMFGLKFPITHQQAK